MTAICRRIKWSTCDFNSTKAPANYCPALRQPFASPFKATLNSNSRAHIQLNANHEVHTIVSFYFRAQKNPRMRVFLYA